MFLTREEEAMLAGEKGEGTRTAMELLVALGDIYEAKRLVPIASAHLSGVSYKTIGEGGIGFLESLAKDAKVCVPTTLNPAGMDRQKWREMGISPRFGSRATSKLLIITLVLICILGILLIMRPIIDHGKKSIVKDSVLVGAKLL
jgi:predicted aconitase